MKLYRASFHFHLSVDNFILGTFSTYDKAYDTIVKDIVNKYETRCHYSCKYYIEEIKVDIPDNEYLEVIGVFDDFASDPKQNTKYIYANEMEKRRFKERW
jgi:hypothetical protein